MNSQKFLRKLNKKLAPLPKAERQKALDYYREQIEDRVEAGYAEEAAVWELGDVRDVADSIISDAKERGVKMRFTAGWAIAGGILGVLCGLALVWGLVWLAENFDDKVAPAFSRAGGEWIEHNEEFTMADGEGLIVEILDQDLFIGVSKDDMAHVTYYENDAVKFSAEKTEGSLVLKQLDEKTVRFIRLSKPRQTIILLPQSFNGDIAVTGRTSDVRVDPLDFPGGLGISTTTGDIAIYDVNAGIIATTQTTGELIIGRCVSADGIVCVTTTGDMDISQVSASDYISLTTSTGEVKLKEASAKSVTVSTNTGELELASVTAAEGVKAKATTGEIKANGVTSQSFEVKTTTGEIRLASITAEAFTQSSTTGSVGFSGVDAKELSFHTTTGSIHGELAGSIKDYTITSHTTTGGNSLPGDLKLGERTLHAEASTGAIKITFADDE